MYKYNYVNVKAFHYYFILILRKSIIEVKQESFKIIYKNTAYIQKGDYKYDLFT